MSPNKTHILISYKSGTFPKNGNLLIELLDYLERHGLISNRHYGFRHKRSTWDLLASISIVIDGFSSSSHNVTPFYRYTNGLCSSELSSMMPQRNMPARQTRLTLASHPNLTLNVREFLNRQFNNRWIGRGDSELIWTDID
ncbi:unnamed protein product [Acanthoscelides obtectus]|uniref:Uncharacterized protein n=1 Tax=Acanthoscelides obtectus TaxID=200917 RepID=A0A9P0MER9_ACAOB|nr:unnamed protein product [Acanthoscelides obtectus]CAK1679743.1 hypothetical protein AOBTE_LOCUS32426 [Acanthoscelides obtectus]